MRTRRPAPWEVATISPFDVGMSDVPDRPPLPSLDPALPTGSPALPSPAGRSITPDDPAKPTPAAAASDTSKTTVSKEPWSQNAAQAVDTQGKGTTHTGGGQWIRQIKLTVYGAGAFAKTGQIAGSGDGTGLDLSQLRINFSVRKTTSGQSANLFKARVYNLSKPNASNPNAPNTVEKIKQYARVQLACGYLLEKNLTMIFDGTVLMYIVGKENATETYVEILAGDADEMLNSSYASLTWPSAGSTPSQRVKDMLNQAGVPIGQVIPAQGEQKSIRGQSYIGMLNKGIRREINATNSDFWIDNGKAYVVPWDGYLPSEIVNLSPQTGMVNVPKVTPNGIEVDCLLNPKLRLGTLVKIQSDLLSDVPYLPGAKNPYTGTGLQAIGANAAGGNSFQYPAPAVSPVGIYKIMLLNHFGDTKQNMWRSSIVGLACGADGKLLQSAYLGTAFLRARKEISAGGFSSTPVPDPGLPTPSG